MYSYYFKVSDEEHYLNATEIAGMMGLMTEKGLQHTRLVGAALHKIQANSCTPQAFYFSGKSMMSVYPASIYGPAIRYLQWLTSGKREGTCQIDGKNYKFVKKGPADLAGTKADSIIFDEINY